MKSCVRYIRFGALIWFLCWFPFCGAQQGKLITYEKQMLIDANTALRNKKYKDALFLYTEIRKAYPRSEAAVAAQYRIGFVNILYDNPDADWKTALEEFKRFQSLYPNDPRIHEVNTWIRLLTAIENSEDEYIGALAKLKTYKNRHYGTTDNFSTIFEALKRCKETTDSLYEVNEKLQRAIMTLEEM